MKRQWLVIRGLGREGAHSKDFLEKLQLSDPESTVKCIDLPGAGEFFRLSSPLSINGIAEFVYSQIKNDRPQERYVLSVSLGAMVWAEVVRLYPECTDGLVLCNSSFANLSPFYHRLQLEAFMHIYRAATAANLQERERAVLDMVSNRPDRQDFMKPWSEIALERPVSSFNFMKQLFAAATYKVSEQKPPMPVLVLSSACDRMVSPECSKKLAELWDVPIETHPTAGHELWLDDAEWVIEKAKKFFSL
jgi:pimeloyl-[acyl-carrier protein] methyl ester esterase